MSKHYSFTLNNYNDDQLALIRSAVDRDNAITYLCFGFEVGENGTPHLQGYLQLSSRRALNPIKRMLGISEIHLEASRGSSEDNIAYCSKEGPIEEYGDCARLGRRGRAEDTDWSRLMDDIRNGMPDHEIAITHPREFIRYHSGIDRAIRIFNRRTFTLPSNYNLRWSYEFDQEKSIHLWGAPGIGKTIYAQMLLPNALFVSHLDQLRTYNNRLYEGIIFDDMAFNHLPREGQIHLVDMEQERAIHVRYGVAIIPAGTKRIFVSNFPDIFIDDEAIMRRIQRIHLV